MKDLKECVDILLELFLAFAMFMVGARADAAAGDSQIVCH
jgi:hypothetical protein